MIFCSAVPEPKPQSWLFNRAGGLKSTHSKAFLKTPQKLSRSS